MTLDEDVLTTGDTDDHHWSSYAERCVHCGFEPSAPDSLWRVVEPDLVFECPQCGTTVDVGPQS